MAIDRTKAYRKTWVNDRGWNLTLDIIPAGEFVNTSNNIDGVTYVAMERGMISVKTQKMSFNKRPIGCRDAASLEVEFEFTDLQDNLKEILKKPFYAHSVDGYPDIVTTNIFILKSDRGTNLATEYIEFCGGQKATLSNSYKMRRDPATGGFITQGCTIEAIDVMKLVLEQVETQYFADTVFSFPASPYLGAALTSGNALHDWILVGDGYAFKTDRVSVSVLNGTNPNCSFYKLAYLFNQGLIQATFLNLAAWTRNTPLTYNMTCDNSPLVAMEFYEQGDTLAHTHGSTLTDVDVLVVGMVDDGNGVPTAGMLMSNKDGESYLEYKYLWDLLKNLCEGFCCKFTYKPLMIADALSVPRLSYALSYDRMFHNPSNTVIDLTNRFADAQEEDFDFTPCSEVITSVTTEMPNLQDPDINNFEAKTTGTNSDARLNVKLVHHNLPTADIREGDIGNYRLSESRLHMRKLYYNRGGIPMKIHETTRINDQLTYTDYNDYTTMPEPLQHYTFAAEQRVGLAEGWAIETQGKTGLPFAVSNFLLDRFSNSNQNEIPVTMFMVDGETMPENCGDITLIPVIDGFEGSEKANMVDMEANWQAGTIDVTFLTRGV